MIAISPTRHNPRLIEQVMTAKLIREGFTQDTTERRLLARKLAGGRAA